MLEGIRVLEDAGFETWCVGGAVRDAIMGRTSYDFDLATQAPWQEGKALFEAAGYSVIESGVTFGTITAIVDEVPLEITTYRTESEYSDQRHPDHIETAGTIEQDLARRDFKMNAIAFHPERGILDPYNGIRDIRSTSIHAVGDARDRMHEDALRILRAVRFQSKLGFYIGPETKEAMRLEADGLKAISTERIRRELDAILMGDYVHDALVQNADILCVVIPELTPLIGFDQRTPYHCYDVFDHTAYVVQNTEKNVFDRWVALLHDFGKPATFAPDEHGQGHFPNHPLISSEIAGIILKRMGFGVRTIEDMQSVIELHDTHIDISKHAIKRFIIKMNGRDDLFTSLLRVKLADNLSKNNREPKILQSIQNSQNQKRLYEELIESGEPYAIRHLAINGSDLIALGFQEGPIIGSVLKRLLMDVVDERIPNTREALIERAQTYLKKRTR